MINNGLFTSKTPEWSTPQDFFDELDKEFHFVKDLCANDSNKKCDDFFSVEDDGLKQYWGGIKGWKWMNPPYGREISDWVEKAYSSGGVVALLPARTDTRWFHNYIYQKEDVEIRFIKGRLKFGGATNSAPFPSMVVIFR